VGGGFNGLVDGGGKCIGVDEDEEYHETWCR